MIIHGRYGVHCVHDHYAFYAIRLQRYARAIQPLSPFASQKVTPFGLRPQR